MKGFLQVTGIILLLLAFTACRKSLPEKNSGAGQDPAPAPAPPPPRPPYIEKDPPVLKPVVFRVNNVIGGYYEALPSRYDSLTDYKYPLLIFIHGAGQVGNGNQNLPLVLQEGIPKLIADKTFPASFEVDGKHHSFIILAPQLAREISADELYPLITHALSKYRIDTKRIYLTGFSMGGILVSDLAAKRPGEFAALVAMAGVSKPNADLASKCSSIVAAKLPVWAFHNNGDDLISVNDSKTFVSTINNLKPETPAKLTLFSRQGPLGHDAWTRATNPAFKENGINIYEWMLKFSR